jgi:hypothetical protein
MGTTDSMEQSPWEANDHSTTQEIPRLLLNAVVYYNAHESTTDN